VNNDIGLVNYQRQTGDSPLMNPITMDHHTKSNEQMSGEGFTDIMKSIYNKGKDGVKFLYNNKGAIADAYSSELGNSIRNALPNSDETGRPGFAGEKHAILKLPNGKYGVGNYIGPGTQIVKRLERGDPPRTQIDRVAMGHDIRYQLAKNVKDIRRADNIMINKVFSIEKNKGDSQFNINQGKLIQGKILAEDLGIIRKGSFSSADMATRKIPDKERLLLMSKLGGLAHEGYGMKVLPGDQLKMKLLKQIAREKTKGMKGKTGAGGILDFVVSNVLPNLMSAVGIPKGLVSTSQLKNIISKSLDMIQSGSISSIIDQLSKTILPILVHLKTKAMGGGGLVLAGKGKKKTKLLTKLRKGLLLSFKLYIHKKKKGLKGKGLNLAGFGDFWSDFKDGFLSVFRPAGEILAEVATALVQPEIGIPLGLLADNI
jgi:hypothetical protein